MFMNAIDKSWIIDDLCREVGVRFFTLFLLSRPPWVGVGGPVWQEERETRHPGGGRGDERTRSDWVSGKRKTPSRRKRGQTRGATWSSVLLFLLMRRCRGDDGAKERLNHGTSLQQLHYFFPSTARIPSLQHLPTPAWLHQSLTCAIQTRSTGFPPKRTPGNL